MVFVLVMLSNKESSPMLNFFGSLGMEE
jgi:hypothetical protein